jgi:hypothetical protein
VGFGELGFLFYDLGVRLFVALRFWKSIFLLDLLYHEEYNIICC